MKVRATTMNNKQNGAVSLFIVIFTTLLISIIAVGFIRIMLSDQRQATASDLSQSAYDSAQAGVEDGKRALLDYQAECAKGKTECDAAAAILNAPECNKALKTVIDYIPGQEVMVKKDLTDTNVLQQAYTCVKINRLTDDYIGTLSQDGSKLIPLAGVTPIDSVQLEWFGAKDITGFAVNVPVFVAPPTTPALVKQTDWPLNRPSLMRAQLAQFGSNGFTPIDFDNTNALGQSNANTLFLYPSTIADAPKTFASDARLVANTSGPTQIHCTTTISSGLYACKVTIKLPTPIGGGTRTAYLRLTALYNKSHYKVILLDATGAPVQFDGVQPQIDSTGRANDLFRRVQSRVEVVDTNFPYPDAAVDTTNTFCKSFLITDRPADYSNSCTSP